MSHRFARRPLVLASSVLALAAVAAVGLAGPSAADRGSTSRSGGESVAKPHVQKAVFFAADGLRQDLVAEFAGEGSAPTLRKLLKQASAKDGGLLTQAPPNTGAGWYSLATGAWPATTASTNNTFHINGAPFTARTAAFDPGVLKAESIAQAAERGGLKVAQVEWAGGRNATIQGPTVDYRTFHSGRGVATNFIGAAGDEIFDDAPFITSFGLQFDHPAGYAGQAPFPAAAPAPATGWTHVPHSYSPAQEMRLRVLDFGVDKYGLNAYIYDSTNNGTTDYDRVLFSFTKDGARPAALLREGQWGDVKVKLQGGALDGMTAGFLVRVEVLAPDLSRVRLFHTSVTRAQASWPTWQGEPGFTGTFDEYLAQRFATSTAADFAVLEAGIVSEETYAEQGHYWERFTHPVLRYIASRYHPDLLMVGNPVTDEFSHQFLGLITPKLPGGAPNPAYDDVDLDGVPDGRLAERRGFIEEAYAGADRTLTLARLLMGRDPTTFVSSDHGFAPQFLAIDPSLPLVGLGLLSAPQTSNCRPATADAITAKAKGCWAGGALQIYLNVAGRDPDPRPANARNPTLPDGTPNPNFVADPRIPANQVDATVAQIKAAYLGLSDPNDWTHDGQPEGWKMVDRAFTKAEARAIPNGPGSTTDMAHPTRTGDLVVFAYPPYQWDAATPGTLVAPSHFFGQHGYVPDIRDDAANINMRATFIAGGEGIDKGKVAASTIDLAPTLAYLLGIPEPQHSQGKVLLDLVKGGDKVTPLSVVGLNDFHGQLDPTTATFDNGLTAPVGGAAFLATLFDEEFANLTGSGLLLAAGDNVGASPPNSALLQDIPAIDVENAWGLDATAYGNHEFDYGIERLLKHQERADFPFLAVNIVETATGQAPWWVTPSKVFVVDGVKVGVIGAALQNTPELVAAGNTAGLTFLPEAQRIKEESQRLRGLGVKVQIVVIHQGTNEGTNTVGTTAGAPWVGPIIGITNELQGTTVDAVIAGHTHRVSNLMVGRILVTEGLNAGGSYSVLQLMVQGGDVDWAGGATRVSKNLGVAPKPSVKSIVDGANADTAPLRNLVIGSQQFDVKRDPTRLNESAMGNFVADALRANYPDVEAAWVNSGGLRADLLCAPPSGTEAACEITWGEAFAVLPFGNATVAITLTGDQLRQAFENGFKPACDAAFAGGTGRFPQISGLTATYTCNGTTPVVTGMWKAPGGTAGTLTPIGPTDSVRLITVDFLYTGGDGYTIFRSATNVLQKGDLMLDVVIAAIKAGSPIGPVVDGRIVKS